MKNISIFLLSGLLSFIVAGAALGHNASITISSPLDGADIVVDSLPANVSVQGTITHGSPGNVNDQRACVTVDGDTLTCEPNHVVVWVI
jgi:hypothetical protein